MTMMLHVWHRQMNHTTLMHANPNYDITYVWNVVVVWLSGCVVV